MPRNNNLAKYYKYLIKTHPQFSPQIISDASTSNPIPRTMSRTLSPHKNPVQSVTSDCPWRSDNPFGPPQVQRSVPSGIKRLRDTLSKLSPSAFAEKDLLRKKNQYKTPLTERNVDTLVTEQECNAAYKPSLHSPEIQVTEWLQRVS